MMTKETKNPNCRWPKGLMIVVLLLALAACASTRIAIAARPMPFTEPKPDTLIITMDQVKGFGPFSPSSGFLRELTGNNPWMAAVPEVTGVPDTLSDLRVFVRHMHFKQHAWQSWKAGLLDSSFVMGLFPPGKPIRPG